MSFREGHVSRPQVLHGPARRAGRGTRQREVPLSDARGLGEALEEPQPGVLEVPDDGSPIE